MLAELLKAFLDAIDVGGDVVHHDLQFTGLSAFLFAEECMLDPHDVLVVHLLVNLKLAALVFLVLLQLLDRLPGRGVPVVDVAQDAGRLLLQLVRRLNRLAMPML